MGGHRLGGREVVLRVYQQCIMCVLGRIDRAGRSESTVNDRGTQFCEILERAP